jgi:hypothetical protein
MAHYQLANGIDFIQMWVVAAGYADCDKELFNSLKYGEFVLRDYYLVKKKSVPTVS